MSRMCKFEFCSFQFNSKQQDRQTFTTYVFLLTQLQLLFAPMFVSRFGFVVSGFRMVFVRMFMR